MWWIADKVAYRNEDNFRRAYKDGEIIWEKIANNQIFYKTSNNVRVAPYIADVSGGGFGANIVSNVYSDGLGVITFDGDVTRIGVGAFSILYTNTSHLTTVIIPNSVTRIEQVAFFSDLYPGSEISYVNIPTSVSYSGERAFQGTDITSIYVSPQMRLGVNVFRNCSDSVLEVVVDPNNRVYDSRDNCNCIIETATNKLLFGCVNSFIPNTIVKIGANAFEFASFLRNLTIPASVSEIGDYAFEGCTNLREVIVNATVPPTAGYYIFRYYNSNYLTIKVPAGSVEAYKSASGWSDYAAQIVAQ